MNFDDDARSMGRRLRQIRQARRKSLRVVAGLAGISAGHLSRIENGRRALDSRSLTVALANALQVSPSEVTTLPIPAPSNGGADASIAAVRLALMAVSRDRPSGQVLGVAELAKRASAIESVDYHRRGALLPGLILNLHATLAAGRDVAELIKLAVMLHAQTVRGWLLVVGAPLEHATRVAQRTGQGSAFRLGFGPVNGRAFPARLATRSARDLPRLLPRPARGQQRTSQRRLHGP